VTVRSVQSLVLIVLLAATLAGGCSRSRVASPGSVSRDPNILLAYVCCGLVPAIEDAKAQFESENAGKSVRIEGGEPESLVERIRSGAVPDLVIFPGDAEMGILEREGFLDRGSRQAIGSLRTAVAVRRSNPVVIDSYAALTTNAVRSIAMSTPGITSLGTDGKQALERAGVWSKLQGKLSLQTSALGALEQVVWGQADAAIVYDPCFALSQTDRIPPGSLRIVALPRADDERPVSVYVVVHKRSPNTLLAQRLIRLLESRQLQPPSASPPADAGEQPEEPE
jgi:molybdate transport system substrate-binding protein